MALWQHTARTAFRSFRNQRIYRLLNVGALAISFAGVALVAIFLHQELTYDTFHSKSERIYRPTHKISGQNGFEVHFARVPVNFINEIPDEFPEVEELVRFQNQEQKHIRVGENRFRPQHAYQTDAAVFQVFDLPLVQGDAESALSHPLSVVLSEEEAMRYFGHTDVLGEELYMTGDWTPDEQPYRVTGVMEDLPGNTHLPIDVLFSFASEEERRSWAYIYLLLREGADIRTLRDGLPRFMADHTDPSSEMSIEFVLQPLENIHLQSHLAREIIANGNMLYVRIAFWVAFGLWVIALINVTNLSTALAFTRAKDVGVRKVLGAHAGGIRASIMAESCIYAAISGLVASAIVVAALPYLSQWLEINVFPHWSLICVVSLVLVLVTGLISGIIPTRILSRGNSTEMLRSGWRGAHTGHKWNRSTILVGAQFCIGILLVSSCFFAWHQMRYMEEMNLGFAKDQILTISNVPDEVTRSYPTLKNELLSIPGIQNVTACMQMPSTAIRDSGPLEVQGRNQEEEPAPMVDMQIVDPDFTKMMDLKFVAGGDFVASQLGTVPEFSQDFGPEQYLEGEQRTYLINEAAMHDLGYNDAHEVIGKQVRWSIANFDLAYGPVVGVVRDYHQESLHQKVDPTVFTIEPLWLGNILVKVNAAELESVIPQIEQVWKRTFPYAFEYSFLDEMFSRLYHQDRVQLQLLSALTLVALFISLVGLMALIAYALQMKSKELAIRRVIGANLFSLVELIGKGYLWVLAVACVIGIPLSYLAVSRWLENFAYRVEISASPYLLTVGLFLALLLLIIFLQTWQTTRRNPIAKLRDE